MGQEVPARTPWHKVWSWLRTGHTGDDGYFTYVPMKREPLWRAPVRVWRVLMRRRSAHPVPLLYVVVGGIGLLVGFVLRKPLRGRWWFPPVALVGAAWSYFVSSIWWRSARYPTSLRTDLLAAVAPKRGARRRARESRERFLASRLPLFGTNEGGPPELSGMGTDGERTTHFSIRYPSDLVVGVVEPDTEHGEVEEHLRGELISLRMNERADQLPNTEDTGDRFERVISETRDLQWSDTVLTIDGNQVHGFSTALAGHVAGVAQTRSCWVMVIAPASKTLPHLRQLARREREKLSAAISLEHHAGIV